MGLVHAGVERDYGVVLLYGFRLAAESDQRPCEDHPRGDVVGVARYRSRTFFQGFLEVALAHVEVGQSGTQSRFVGVESRGSLVGCECDVVVAIAQCDLAGEEGPESLLAFGQTQIQRRTGSTRPPLPRSQRRARRKGNGQKSSKSTCY